MSIESIWLNYFNQQTSNLMLGGLNVVCILYSKSNVSLSTNFMRSKERKKNKIRKEDLLEKLALIHLCHISISHLVWLVRCIDCSNVMIVINFIEFQSNHRHFCFVVLHFYARSKIYRERVREREMYSNQLEILRPDAQLAWWSHRFTLN